MKKNSEDREKAEQMLLVLTMEMNSLRRYKKISESEKKVTMRRIQELQNCNKRLLKKIELLEQQIN